MTFDEIEIKARYIVKNNGNTTDFIDNRLALGDRLEIAESLLLVLPVARAASQFEATRRAVLLGKDTHAELLRRGENLENAVDTMRAALEGK